MHITDGNKRIAMIDSLTVDAGIILGTPTDTIRYQYDNHLGSASLELDENANTISYEEYHPFGTTSYRLHRNHTEASLKRYRYVGKERDEETGLYYYGARYYAAWIGRWTTTEPLMKMHHGFSGNAEEKDRQEIIKLFKNNPYNYVENKPIVATDPDGKKIVIIGTKEYRKHVKAALKTLATTPEGERILNKLASDPNNIVIHNSKTELKNRYQGLTKNDDIANLYINFNPYDNKPADYGERDTATSAGHELRHAESNLDYFIYGKGENPQEEMYNPDKIFDDNGNYNTIKIDEKNAIHSENLIRESLGMDLRNIYDIDFPYVKDIKIVEKDGNKYAYPDPKNKFDYSKVQDADESRAFELSSKTNVEFQNGFKGFGAKGYTEFKGNEDSEIFTIKK